MKNIYNFEYGIASQMEEDQLLTNQDETCFEEIRQILQKHKSLDRFGLTLLDKEELPEDQIRLETNSIAERTLLTQTMSQKASTEKVVQTNWALNTLKTVSVCQGGCVQNNKNRHSKQHGNPE